MKKNLLPLFCILVLLLSGCSNIRFLSFCDVVPESVVIDGVTYRNGFYGDLYPVFGEIGDIGSETLQEEIVYENGTYKFRRINFEGHDWVHCYGGGLSGGVVYCEKSQWEETHDYYANPANYEYYYGVGHYISEKSVSVPEMNTQMFDALLAFGLENEYNPFNEQSNKNVMKNIHRMPETEFRGSLCFFKVSDDGYFTTAKSPMYFVHDGKLRLVFYHDGGRNNGGIKEVLYVDVPDELGQYFLDLTEQHQEEIS